MTKYYRVNRTHLCCCGVNEVGHFANSHNAKTPDGYYLLTEIEESGTGLFTATFTQNQEHYKEALSEQHELVYDSGWMYNNNSHNEMCLCVFKHKAWEQQEPEPDDEDDFDE